MAVQVVHLPYRLGRFSTRSVVFLVMLALIVAQGVFAYSQQYIHGLVVTGLRDIGTMGGAAWGLYIAFDVYFVGVSFAGITMAALIRLFRLERLRPVSRLAEVLTIVALILAAFSILPDVGQPVRALVNLFRYARPQSPFFGTFTLVVAGYLFASLVYLYLDLRRDAALLAQHGGRLQGFYRLWAAGYRDTPAERARHERVTFWLAIAIVPLLITAHSTLGFVFGIQAGRPGWFSTLQAPGFVVMAGVSGIGLLLVITAIMRKILGQSSRFNEDVFRWLGTLLFALILTYLYFMVAEMLTTLYTGHHHEVRVSFSLIVGDFAPLFWITVSGLILAAVGLLLPRLAPAFRARITALSPWVASGSGIAAVVLGILLLAQASGVAAPFDQAWHARLWWLFGGLLFLLVLSLLPRLAQTWVSATTTAGILVNVAAIAKRLLIVVPSQTHGTLLPYSTGWYVPTWVEISIIVGLFALGTLMYILFFTIFPVTEVHAEEGGEQWAVEP